MRKMLVVITVIIVVLLLSSFWKDIYYYSIDNMKWKRLSSNIKDENVSKIILDSKNTIGLVGAEKSDFIKNLSEAKFYRSNWRKIGPTGAIITMIFKDGSEQNFEYWGSATFETTFENGQFLIKSNEIERVLKKYNITLD